MSSSSIKLSFDGGQVGCTRNTSRPRTFSINLDVHLAVAEPPDVRPSQRHVQMARDLLRQRRVRVAGEHREGSGNRTLCWTTYDRRNTGTELAGVEGFEPPYGGIKTRCLTAWRHPNLKIRSPAQPAPPAHAPPVSSSRGESLSPRAEYAMPFRRQLAEQLAAARLLAGQKNARARSRSGAPRRRATATRTRAPLRDIGAAPPRGSHSDRRTPENREL